MNIKPASITINFQRPAHERPEMKNFVWARSSATVAGMALMALIVLSPGSRLMAGVTGGFVVDISSREEVRSFYIGVYPSSDGVPIDSTANVATCTPGANSTAFRESVLRRVNWFRAMAGVPASNTFDATYTSDAQQAALIMAANDSLSHAPPSSWTCWTSAGSNAANHCNLHLGQDNGPDAITGYMADTMPNNYAVGHRRNMLHPSSKVMGTGDIPAQNPHFAANALWVLGSDLFDPRPATRTPYVSWPPPGFVPYQVVFSRWSFGYTNADFSSATVTMLSNNVPISTSIEAIVNGFPIPSDHTLVWIPAGFPSDGTGTWPVPTADTAYSVTVGNVVINGVSSNFTYNVTVFDPATLGPDSHPPTISGSSQPAVGQNNAYTFTAVPNATSYEWRQTERVPYSLVDGAENGTGNFTVSADGNAGSVIVSSPVASGSHSFHLCHDSGAFGDQILLLNAVLYPTNNSVLNFKSRLGYATSVEFAKVELSQDDGRTWSAGYSQAGTGGMGETTFASRTVSLSSFSGRAVRLRFNLAQANSVYFCGTGSGWYLDDIVLTNVEQLLSPVISPVGSTDFVFNPAQTGTYNLDVRALVYGDFPLEWGPTKLVTAVASGPAAMVKMLQPLISGNQVQLDFDLLSGSPGIFTLQGLASLTDNWSDEIGAVLTTNVPGSSYRFTVTTNGEQRFFRIQIQ